MRRHHVEDQEKEILPIDQAAKHMLEECRMVLPGIQALFGFQLIAVINKGFGEKLSPTEQALHLAAIGLVAVAVALVMGPAAYHRQTGIREVSEHFLEVCSRLLLWSMVPLMFGITLDFFLISHIITHHVLVSVVLAAILFCVFTTVWFILPRWNFLRQRVGRDHQRRPY